MHFLIPLISADLAEVGYTLLNSTHHTLVYLSLKSHPQPPYHGWVDVNSDATTTMLAIDHDGNKHVETVPTSAPNYFQLIRSFYAKHHQSR